MFENNKYFDDPAQVTYQFLGETDEYKGIAIQDMIIDLASGEIIYLDTDEVNIIHISSSWSPYFLD